MEGQSLAHLVATVWRAVPEDAPRARDGSRAREPLSTARRRQPPRRHEPRRGPPGRPPQIRAGRGDQGGIPRSHQHSRRRSLRPRCPRRGAPRPLASRFHAIVVITLALGVGANAAMFGLVDDLMLRPPDGVGDPDRVVAVNGVSNYVDLQDLRPQLETLELAAYTRRPLSFGRGVDAIEVRAECVTPEFFPVLGATPIVGRAFEPGEDVLGKPRTAILSHGFWRRQFGGVPEVVGRDVSIAGRAHTIVGVAAQAFNGVQLGAVDVCDPDRRQRRKPAPSRDANLLRSQGGAWLRTVGRIRDGVNAAAAAADLRAARLEPPPGVLPRCAPACRGRGSRRSPQPETTAAPACGSRHGWPGGSPAGPLSSSSSPAPTSPVCCRPARSSGAARSRSVCSWARRGDGFSRSC